MPKPNIQLVLVCERAGRAIPLARVADTELVKVAARTAIAVASARADEIARTDAVLGALEHAEARRLRDVLDALVPGMAASCVM
jgi:hypothetical protein